MKKLLIFLVLNIVIFSSCVKKNDQNFSCNEEANKYAISTIIENQNISRDSLVKLSRELQFAIFRSLTPINKKRIFNEKIQLLLDNEMLTEDEIIHLEQLKNYDNLNVYNFDGAVPDSFLVAWEYYAFDNLGWNEEKFETYVGTWMTVGEINSFEPDYTQPISSEQNCTCRSRFGCFGFGSCDEGGCTIPPKGGCGILGTANCIGTCPEDIQPATKI